MGSYYHQHVQRRVREQRILHDVSLELTYGCNLDCFFCYNDREKVGTPLSLAQYEALLEDLAEMQTLYLMLTGGEPMIHPHFFAIGAKAMEQGFATRVRTNGHSLSLRQALRLYDEVRPVSVEISLHGATADVHDRQTRVPGSFNRLLLNLDAARRAGLRCRLVSTPTSWNEHQIAEMFALADSLGLELRFQGPVAPRDNGDTEPMQIQPQAQTWQTVRRELRKRVSPDLIAVDLGVGEGDECATEEDATCSVGVSGVDIDPYGNVQACMHLQASAGNLHDQDIRSIWETSPLFLEARGRAVQAASQFPDGRREQHGAPLFCLAVEENANKGCGDCASGCS
ncbi:radical SAM protein [Halioglobus maricola]|uniref:Radical SAM protein n=1 Tax=Halioglobus maricola TaxID=2601894 RepID=A0A5P9NFN5_9GAMM|nr:radical SAM protein [Halioglobus maricola]QFU74592.1 radical SAM protein [Halioglobus maricola]